MKSLMALSIPALFFLAGCVTSSAPGSVPLSEPVGITLETGPCFGACPVYRVEIREDGSGTFVGRRFTAVEGEQSLNATPRDFHAFSRHLAPLRPVAGTVRYSGETCEMMATDLPSTEVTWRGRDGSVQQLYFYHGCDMEKNRAMSERLRSAPALLPIAELVGSR